MDFYRYNLFCFHESFLRYISKSLYFTVSIIFMFYKKYYIVWICIIFNFFFNFIVDKNNIKVFDSSMIMPGVAQFMRLLASACVCVRLCASARVCLRLCASVSRRSSYLASVCVCLRLCASVCVCLTSVVLSRVCVRLFTSRVPNACVCVRLFTSRVPNVCVCVRLFTSRVPNACVCSRLCASASVCVCSRLYASMCVCVCVRMLASV